MSTSPSLCSSIEDYSNLQSFLHSVTPIINHNTITNTITESQANNESRNARLKLHNIWVIYDEWSSCGVGVPVLLESGEKIIQYYVPYLSAIQIFIKKPTSTSSEEEINLVALQSNSSSGVDASTKSSNDLGSERISNDSRSYKTCFLGDKGHLYMQFFETCSPYFRMPFLDKIVELAQSYPGLLSFNVKDLSPASWMSIAWYPIYHIPYSIYSNKDLNTCFLTFHTLSCSFKDNLSYNQAYNNEEEGDNGENEQELDLSPFGLTTHRMSGDVWNHHKDDDNDIKDLESAASSWLKQLDIHHPDYIFFTQ